ncbi:MAG: MBL fold metallo-hydrolase [Saprospiraceae bacterium]
MYRRTFIQSSGLALPLSTLPSWFNLFIPTAYKMKLLRRNVGIFSEIGGTIGWLIQPDSIVVVDAQFREQAGHLIDEIKKFPAAPVKYLINTHHHGDHTSGNIAFKGLAEHILAHENSKTNQIATARKNGNESEQLYPDITFNDRWQQQVGDEFIDIQYWGPAHTNGDTIIHFQHANIAHIGDLMFNRKYPYIDKSAGAMIENWVQILGQLQSYFDNDTMFIFGHANDGYQVTGNKDDLAAFADYLTALMEFVRSQLRADKSKKEILAATEIPGNTQWSGEGIQRSLSAALEELGY